MSRIVDLARMLTASSSMATDAEVSAASAYIPANVAGKNFVINGNFDFWQRGTSFVSPMGVYTTDRWSNDTSNMTISQQSSGAPSGSLYYLRTTSTGGSAYTDFYHFFESNNIALLRGKTVTYSFKIRKSGTTPTGNFVLTLQKSASVDGGRLSTWTTVSTVSTPFSSISTGTSSSDWTTITATADIPHDGTANSLRFIGGFNAAQSSGVVVDIAQVQLEIGSVATPFSRAGGNISTEENLCRRYYQDTGVVGHTAYTTNGVMGFVFPVPMRVTPSATFSYGGTTNNIYRLLDAYQAVLTSPTVIITDKGITNMYAFTPTGWASGAGAGINLFWKLNAEL